MADDLPLLILDRSELRGAPACLVQVAVVPHVPAERLRAGSLALRTRVTDLRVLRFALLRDLSDLAGAVATRALARRSPQHRCDPRLHVAAGLADVGRQRRPTPILVREVRREPVLDSLAASHRTNAHITYPVRLGAPIHRGRSVGHPDELRGAVNHGVSLTRRSS